MSLSAFDITDTEITNAQYRGLQPTHDPKAAPELPAVNVRWQEARALCQEIGGDLPTEAQWEYAARAGSRTPWSFGADVARLDAFAWYGDNSNGTLHAVGQKSPNPWGLYDMHGNAWEWVKDFYGEYSKTPQLDPMRGSGEEPHRVLRGGSFDDPPLRLRSANRDNDDPEDRNRNNGFRCVRVPARQHAAKAPCSVRRGSAPLLRRARSSRLSRPSGRANYHLMTAADTCVQSRREVSRA